MTASVESFRVAYRGALENHLAARGEATLAAGLDLGRRALTGDVSVLEVVETHFRLLAELGVVTSDPEPDQRERGEAALQFLLQTLTVLDVASRGFLDRAHGYARQRERAEHLSEQHAFRRTLLESMQDGFFVADATGTVVEVNPAFGELTGYGPATLPYRWPHPWLPIADPDRADAVSALTRCARDGGGRVSIPVRHRGGQRVWLAVNVGSVTAAGHEPMFVGTIRDVTADRLVAEHEKATARLAGAIAAATGVTEVLTIGLTECRTAIGARRVLAAVWPTERGAPVIHSSGGEAVAWSSLDLGVRAVLDRVRGRPPLTVEANPAVDSARGVAISLSATADVALWIESAVPGPLTTADRALVTLLCSHLTLALQRARSYDQARTASLTLQHAMLGGVDIPPGFAARYEPAVPPLEIGGDWYDAVTLQDGSVGVVVGDCVGRGLAAAAVMGQLRSSARALLLHGSGPGALLDDLDVVAAHTPGAACTTVCAAVIDPRRGTLRYSSAGHLPPVLAGLGAAPRQLDGAHAVPLATFACSPRPEATADLPPGSTVLFYTDGLVERRGRGIDDALGRVGAIVAEGARSVPAAVADLLLSVLRPRDGYEDDVAVLVYRQSPSRLRITTPAEPAQLAVIRRELRNWLAVAAVPEATAADIVSATNEACTNSIEHAYRGRAPEMVEVTAEVEVPHRRVRVSVVDTGRWRTPPATSPERGRGLPLIGAFVDVVDIDRHDVGTRVHMTTSIPSSSGPAGGTGPVRISDGARGARDVGSGAADPEPR